MSSKLVEVENWETIDGRENLEESKSSFMMSIVPADGLANNNAKPSASTVLKTRLYTFIVIYRYSLFAWC